MDCIDVIRQGAGWDMTEEEILGLVEQVKKMKHRVLEGKEVDDAAGEVMAVASTWADRLEVEAVAKKRALQLQMNARLKAVDMVLNTFKGREADGLSALQVGIQSERDGSGLSVDAMGKRLTGQYLGGFLADLNALGKDRYALFKRGAMDKEVAMALFSIDNPATPFRGPKEALEIAQVMHKWQERARLDHNRAGAWIGKEPGYIVLQSHDRTKVLRAGFKQWKADILPLLDWDRTADGRFDPEINDAGINDFLKAVYDDISTGVHPNPATQKNSLACTGTIGSAVARASRERVLHFHNGEAWFRYNQKYGRGNLREACVYGLENAAQHTALMRVFGPFPQTNLESIIDDVCQTLRSRADMAGIDRLNSALPRLHNQMKEIDGTLSIEEHPSLALVGRIVRTMESLSRLGGALLSSFSDAPTFATEFASQGRGFLGSMVQGMAGLLQGHGTAEQQRIMSLCGVFFDSMSGGLVARFAGEELPGKLTVLQQLFFRMNGLGWWTDTWKRSVTLMMSHDLALEKELDWNGLKKERRRVLSLYGIDAGRWDIIRSGQTMAADGRDYLTPEAVYETPDAMLERYLHGQGKQVSAGRVAELRDEIVTQLRTYFQDRVDYAVLEPDVGAGSTLRQKAAAETGAGETLRFVTQFKSFPEAYLQTMQEREFFGRDAKKWGEALRNEYGEISNFARLFLMMTLFGYGSMTAKQFIAGKMPCEPDNPKTWLAAAAQGGGLGIYGDFLLGEKSRMGSSLYSSLAGPAPGSAESVYNLYQNSREGRDTPSETFRLFFNPLPGNNLFWFRTAFDHFIGYNLYEMMSPGYIDRMKRQVEKENNQTFRIKP